MKHNISIIKPKLKGQAITIIADEITYNSLNDLCCRMHVSDSQIRKYKKDTDCSLEEAIDYILCEAEKEKKECKNGILKKEEKYKMKHTITVIKPNQNGQAMTIIINGVTYNSLNDLRCRMRIGESQLRKYRKEMNLSLEEAIDYILCKIEKKQEERRNRRLKETERMNKYIETHNFVYKGVPYKSFAAAISRLNLEGGYAMNASYISTLARKKNITKQDAIDMFLEKRKLR